MNECIIIRTAKDRGRALKWVTDAAWGSVLEFKHKRRSNNQNDALHGLVAQVLRQRPILHERVMTMELWKATFMQALGHEVELARTLDGTGVFPLGLKTSRLSVEQFSDLIEFILCWCADQGLEVKHFDGPPPLE